MIWYLNFSNPVGAYTNNFDNTFDFPKAEEKLLYDFTIFMKNGVNNYEINCQLLHFHRVILEHRWWNTHHLGAI